MALIGLSIFVIPALALIALLIWSLAVILLTPEATWDAAGLNQWMWLAVVIFLPAIGSLLFVLVARTRLQDAGSGLSVEQMPIR